MIISFHTELLLYIHSALVESCPEYRIEVEYV
jgi:hypothetical protein